MAFDQETQAIYTLVLQNLIPHKYIDLIPEAQVVICQEAENLLNSPVVPDTHKKQLASSLNFIKKIPEQSLQSNYF